MGTKPIGRFPIYVMMRFQLLLLGVCLLVGIASLADAHSWVACTDYRGDVNFYEDDKCFGYPRNWASVKEGLAKFRQDYPRNLRKYPFDKGYHIAAADNPNPSFDYKPGLGNNQGTNPQRGACQAALGTGTGSAEYPEAEYEAGQQYCLAWPMKNHFQADCSRNGQGSDSGVAIYRSSVNPSSDPSQEGFKRTPLKDYFGKHQPGQIDCLGFQRAPQACADVTPSCYGTGSINDPGCISSEAAMGTGCFDAPDKPGKYTLQWHWNLTPGANGAYATCFDVTVVAKGMSRNGPGGPLNYASAVSTLNGDTGLCAKNWAAAAAGASGGTGPFPSALVPSNPTTTCAKDTSCFTGPFTCESCCAATGKTAAGQDCWTSASWTRERCCNAQGGLPTPSSFGGLPTPSRFGGLPTPSRFGGLPTPSSSRFGTPSRSRFGTPSRSRFGRFGWPGAEQMDIQETELSQAQKILPSYPELSRVKGTMKQRAHKIVQPQAELALEPSLISLQE